MAAGGRRLTAVRRAGWWSVAVLALVGLVLGAAPPAAAGGRGPGATLRLSAPTLVVAGVPFDVTVTVHQAGRPYVGTVRFSTDDPLVRSLPADYTFTRADRGTHRFEGVTLVGTGHHRLAVRDTRNRGLADTDPVRVANARAAVRGTVLSTMDPIYGPSTVTVYDAVTGKALKSGRTDDQGEEYLVTGLPAGAVKIGAVCDGIPPEYVYEPGFANNRDTFAEADVFHLRPGHTLRQSWDLEPFFGPYLDLDRI